MHIISEVPRFSFGTDNRTYQMKPAFDSVVVWGGIYADFNMFFSPVISLRFLGKLPVLLVRISQLDCMNRNAKPITFSIK